MRNVALWVLGLALSPLAVAADKPPGCQLNLVADLTAEMGPSGAVVLPVKLNGRDVRMVLDLDSGYSAIYSDALEVTGLKAGTVTYQHTASRARFREENIRSGRKSMDRSVVAESLILGKAGFGRFEALLIERTMPRVAEGETPIVGAIGSSLFAKLDVELNLSQRKVRLFKATDCKDPPVYWNAEVTSVASSYDEFGTLAFTMQLDGQKVFAGFDTAWHESTLDARTTERFFGFAPDAPELERVSREDGAPALFRAMTLSAEGLSVRNTRVRLVDERHPTCFLSKIGALGGGIGYDNCVNATPLSIGTDILRRLRLIVVSKQGRIYFTAAAPGS